MSERFEPDFSLLIVGERFLSLRGAPLTISPADFEILEGWQREGIPSALTLKVMDEFFAGIDRRGKSRSITLSYLAPAVEERWQALVEILTPGLREGQTIHDLF